MITTRKSEIETAAARLFGEKGYAGASVRDIAQAVGLGAASLYNHIGSKDELLTSICFRCAQKFLDGMEQILQTDASPIARIEALIGLHIRIALNDKSSVTVFNDEWRHLPPAELEDFLKLRRTYETTFLTILEEGMQDEKIRISDPYVMYQVILSSLRWLHAPGWKKMKINEHELTQIITQQLLKGIVI